LAFIGDCFEACEDPAEMAIRIYLCKRNMTAQEFCTEQDDALDFLRSQESSSIDLILTDPPYESLEKHRKVGTTTRLKRSKASSNPWFGIFPNALFPDLFKEIHRVLRKDRHFYIFSDPETMFIAKPIAENAGFKFWKPLIWDKSVIGMGYHYRSRYETVLFFEKGKRKLNDLSIPDVLQYKRIRGGRPAEKPVELLETLVLQSSLPGELVCDPFMGSGSTGVAAINHKRRFIGCDIDAESVNYAEERLKGCLKNRSM